MKFVKQLSKLSLLVLICSQSFYSQVAYDNDTTSAFYQFIVGDTQTNIVCDSLIVTYEDSSRESCTFSYDSSGNISSCTFSKLADSSWKPYKKFIYTYNNSGNMTSFLHLNWGNSEWNNYYLYTYTYDGQNLESVLFQKWTYKGWENNSLYNYTYDSNNNITSELYKKWDYSYWKNSHLYSFTYNSDGNRVESYYQNWSSNAWINNRRDSSAYNSTGKETLVNFEWDEDRWEKSYRYDYTYNDDQKLSSRTKLLWRNSDSTWGPCYMYKLAYDSTGRLAAKTYYAGYDYYWVPQDRHIFTFDNNGNKVSELTQYYYGLLSWYDDLLYSYAYDDNNNLVKWSSGNWDGTNWEPYSDYFTIASTTEESLFYFICSEVEITYKTIITDIKNETTLVTDYALSQNYPNPFNPTTTINYTLPQSSFVELKVYNLLGEKVATLVSKEQTSGSYKVNFNAKHLASGVYFYQLRANDFVETKKLLLLK